MKEIKLNDLIGLNSFPILKVSNEEMELMMKKLLVLLSLSLVSSLGFACVEFCDDGICYGCKKNNMKANNMINKSGVKKN